MEENFLSPEELKLKSLSYWKMDEHERGIGTAQRLADVLIALLNKLSLVTATLKEKEDDLKKNNVPAEAKLKNFLLDILEVSDSFENVFASLQGRMQNGQADREAEYLKDRFRSIYENILKEKLLSAGVTPIEVIKRCIPTPGKHNVIGSQESEEMEEGVICEEVRRGYFWRGEILRQSWVKIAVKRKTN